MRANLEVVENASVGSGAVDRPHVGVEPIELRDAQREPRNAGPPWARLFEPARVGWGPIRVDGVDGYGERLADGRVQYWRPLPPRHAPSE